MKSTSSGSKRPKPPAKLTKEVGRKLLVKGSSSKTALATSLQILHEEGLLNLDGDQTTQGFKRMLQEAAEDYCLNWQTPYGVVMQQLNLQSTKMGIWEYVHPMAYLHLLTSQSTVFADLMKGVLAEHDKLSIVIYVDEATPGDPLRHNLQRAVQCIYWSFAEFPDHVLTRAEAWMVFGIVRTKVVAEIDGYMSCLMKHVLLVFFPERGPSFLDGVVLLFVDGHSQIVIAVFEGFLGDEKGLKELMDLKGSAGMVPCITCPYARQHMSDEALSHGTTGSANDVRLVSLYCCRRSDFVTMSNATFWRIIDRLETNQTTKSKAVCLREETLLGIKYNPDGLWFNKHLRMHVLNPVDNYIRDPMHTLVSQGVCNTELYFVLTELPHHKSLAELQDFSDRFQFPSSLPPAKKYWFSADRLSALNRSVMLFANEVIGSMQILLCFLLDEVQPMGVMHDHIKCFELLYCIVQLVMTGCSASATYKAKLQSMVEAHHQLSMSLYGDTYPKPKLHHLIHLGDYNRLLSCFVTERKHKDTRGACLWVFRNVEKTATCRVINQQTERLIEADDMFTSTVLIDPLPAVVKGTIQSRSIRLPCGTIKSGDHIWVKDAGVGCVRWFWQQGFDFVAAVNMYDEGADMRTWTLGSFVSFIDTSKMLTAVAWYKFPSAGPNAIKIVLPVLARMQL
jgi:hypothetical protein